VHRSTPKPKRVARKPAPHRATRPAQKQARHSAKPKKPVKVARVDEKHKEPIKPSHPETKPKAPARLPRPVEKPKEPNKLVRPVPKPNERHPEPARFVGRRHSLVHHFAHFDDRHHWYAFDRNWWYCFVDYPNVCDDGLDVPGNYFTDGDQGPWVNYETVVPTVDVQVEPPAIKEGEGLPISRAGAVLAQQLDAMDVESHWLPGQNVSWETGNPIGNEPGPASNGAAFVAAVGARLKVPMPEPVPGNFFPDSQYDWLVNQGTGVGWVAVGDVEAQLLANQGWMVVATWNSPSAASDHSMDGQTAIVRPSSKPVEAVAARGPQLAVAGPQNHSDIALKDAFPPASWNQVVYLACRPRW
jgi:hypothetical protein